MKIFSKISLKFSNLSKFISFLSNSNSSFSSKSRCSSSSITLKVLDSYFTFFTTKELRDDYALNLDLNEDNKEI
jgi:hypothetical protein